MEYVKVKNNLYTEITIKGIWIMLSQLVRNNVVPVEELRTKATKFSDDFKINQPEQSEDMEKLSEYIKQQIVEPEICEEDVEVDKEYINENPDEFVVEFSDIYKEKEEHLPFFRSIQAQLQAIYG